MPSYTVQYYVHLEHVVYNSLFVYPLSLLQKFFLILSFPTWQVYYVYDSYTTNIVQTIKPLMEELQKDGIELHLK